MERGGDRPVAKDELRMGLATVDVCQDHGHALVAENATRLDLECQNFGSLGEASSGRREPKRGTELKTADEVGIEPGLFDAGR